MCNKEKEDVVDYMVESESRECHVRESRESGDWSL